MAIFRNHILICCLCIFASPADAQLFPGTSHGFNIGVVSALGNRFQRIGLSFQAYYYHDFAQVSASVRAYHNFKNPGPDKRYNELVVSTGLIAGYGKQQNEHNRFFGEVTNETRYVNSIGYSYNVYLNKIKTTQQTGIIALQFNKVSIISENDIFARPMLDRFRTGAFLVQYQYKTCISSPLTAPCGQGKWVVKLRAIKNCPMLATWTQPMACTPTIPTGC